jgi:HD-GYP domain-containing protein (c-di-GMP phosphodiesterase class II)
LNQPTLQPDKQKIAHYGRETGKGAGIPHPPRQWNDSFSPARGNEFKNFSCIFMTGAPIRLPEVPFSQSQSLMDTGDRLLKKIKVEDLKVGMFVVNVDRPWFKHPFLTAQKKITSENQIHKLQEYGIQEVYIDPERGLDTPVSQPPEDFSPAPQPIVGTEEERALVQELPADTAQKVIPFSSEPPEEGILWAKEIEMARVVQREAQIVIRDILQDVRLGKNIESERVKRVVNSMIDSIFHNQAALVSLTRIKDYDEYTFVHSINVCIFCLTLGRHLNFSREELEQMGIGALLHDIGKMKIPPHILNKAGKLTEKEFAEIKKHPLYTLELLEKAKDIPEASKDVALQHHERYNGRGYPYGLKAEEIGRFGQIAAIIDVYDAITTDRVYKKAIPLHEGIRTIYQGIREDFNQVLVERFIQCVGIYPAGTLVLLDSGEIGIVSAVNQDKLLRPNVLLIHRDGETPYRQPFVVDLMEKGEDSQGFKRTIARPIDFRQWNIPVEDFLKSLKGSIKDPGSPAKIH